MKTGAQKSVFDLCSKPAVCKNVQLCKISHQSPGVVTDDDWWINHVRYSVFFFNVSEDNATPHSLPSHLSVNSAILASHNPGMKPEGSIPD